MDISTVRPKIAKLSFQLLGRSVHPELFQIAKSTVIERERYQARIHITSDGHVVSWQADKTTLCEVTSSSNQPLPASRLLLSLPLRDSGGDSLEVRDGIRYKYDYELQRVPKELFWQMQKQLGDAHQNHDLVYIFNSSGRVAIGGLSFIHVETRMRSLHLQAIHTFPDDLALVKTESIFMIDDDQD